MAPKSSTRIPSYRLHKPSGQAVVRLSGRDVYLGRHGSPESKVAYQRHVAEWLASGSSPLRHSQSPARYLMMTVSELIGRYWEYAKGAYKQETLQGTIKPALRRLNRLYGPTMVGEFGPLGLKALRQMMLEERMAQGKRLSRTYINKNINQIKRMFRWALSEELIHADQLRSIESVEALRFGRTDAPENQPKGAVPDKHIESVLPALPPMIADMVRVQRLTGMRPGELCAMTTEQIETSREVWIYRPSTHKTEHHGKSRMIPIGPRAQRILSKYILNELHKPIFSPTRSEVMRRGITKPRTPTRDRKRIQRDRYNTTSYARPIYEACKRLGIPTWSPNQLRHARATELRKQMGLEAAGAVLGHSRLETTQIYAHRSNELGIQAALASG